MWVNREFPDIYTVSLLDEGLYQSYLADISRFAGELRALEPGSWVFVDEIQRLPSLLNEVHRFIEERGHRFVLTGSSARKLRRGGVNLLGGRALVRFMHPFLPLERRILEATLLAFRLPALEAKLRVRERAHPKLYFVHPGLARAVRGAHGAQ